MTSNLIDAALFGFACALVALALILISVCVYKVYVAVFSGKAIRRREFEKRLARNRAHNRKLLGLA